MQISTQKERKKPSKTEFIYNATITTYRIKSYVKLKLQYFELKCLFCYLDMDLLWENKME